jgi:hypothetical protein
VAGGLVQVWQRPPRPATRGRHGASGAPGSAAALRQRAPGPGEPRRAGSSESVCSLSPPRAHCAMITSVARRAIMVPEVRFELLAAPSQVEFKLLGNPTSLPQPSNPKAATRPSPGGCPVTAQEYHWQGRPRVAIVTVTMTRASQQSALWHQLALARGFGRT